MFRSCLRKEYRDQVIKMLRAVPGYSSSLLALKESASTDSNKKFRKERTFEVPREADPTGEIYMPAHMKLPGNYPIKPRIHFTLDTLSTVGKIYIGYVGPHLTTLGTN